MKPNNEIIQLGPSSHPELINGHSYEHGSISDDYVNLEGRGNF